MKKSVWVTALVLVLVAILVSYLYLIYNSNGGEIQTDTTTAEVVSVIEKSTETGIEESTDIISTEIEFTLDSVKEFYITAKRWSFDPEIITVNKGDNVVLHITSVDVTHGFLLPDFDVNEELNPGETIDVQFIADKVGSFSFSCNVFCGSGHSGMDGRLIVV